MLNQYFPHGVVSNLLVERVIVFGIPKEVNIDLSAETFFDFMVAGNVHIHFCKFLKLKSSINIPSRFFEHVERELKRRRKQ